MFLGEGWHIPGLKSSGGLSWSLGVGLACLPFHPPALCKDKREAQRPLLSCCSLCLSSPGSPSQSEQPAHFRPLLSSDFTLLYDSGGVALGQGAGTREMTMETFKITSLVTGQEPKA